MKIHRISYFTHRGRFRLALLALAGLTISTLPLRAADAPGVVQSLAHVTLEIKTDEGKSGDAEFLATQFQILRKREILNEVIDRLDLIKHLSPAGEPRPKSEIARSLLDSITITPVRDTGLIEISVAHPDGHLAADIANTMASVYRDRRLHDLKQKVEIPLLEMKDELNKTEERVRKLYLEAATIRQRDAITDPDPESIQSVVTTGSPEALALLERLVAEQQTRVDRLQARLSVLQDLRPEELRDYLAVTQADDASLSRVLAALSDVSIETAKLTDQGLAENNPRLQAIRAQGEFYKKNLTERAQTLFRGRKVELKVEDDTLAYFQKRLATSREEQTAGRQRSQAYVETKSAYLLEKSLAQVIEQRYAAARFDNALSVECVKIWEKAEAPTK